MAQRVQVILEDDIDHSAADETLRFALDGVSYEIDLSAANAARLRSDFEPWVSRGRRVSGRRTAGRKAQGNSGLAEKIRSWALNNGYTIGDRGRIPAEIRAAYEAAVS